MNEPLQPENAPPNTGSFNSSALFTRRSAFTLMAASAAAMLAACDGASSHVVDDLPDGPSLLRPNAGALVPDPTQYAPPPGSGPPKPLATPVAPPNTSGIIPRSMWARQGPNMQTIGPMNGVRILTFHHSGDPKPFVANDFAGTALHLEYVREYHRSRGFQDIGYHFAIDRVGRVWQLRSLVYQGEHVRFNNDHNIGVVVLGNFDLQPPTQAQKDLIRSFGSNLRRQYNLPISRVFTHQEIVKTECPGYGMQPYMVQIRRQALI